MNRDYVVPTNKLLENLGPGCFVEVEVGDSAVWVEIDDCDGNVFRGRVHAKYSGDNCPFVDQNPLIFVKDQVAHLGCDRYCFC